MAKSAGTTHVVFAVDRDFLPYTAVAAWSLLRQTEQRVHVHVLEDGHLGRGSRRLEQLVTQAGGEITFYRVDAGKLSHLPVTDHVSLATYYRLSIAELLPESIPRVVYLDGDLMVRKCISELYEWPTDPRGVAAAPEPSDSCQRLGLPSGSSYLNAGVLVIDLDFWREHGVTESLYKIADQSRDQLRFWDQDILALYLQGKFAELPSCWNVTHRYFFGDQRLPMPAEQPAIVHFSGAGLKPWNKNVEHPHASEFWQLADEVRSFGFRIKHPDRLRFIKRWSHLTRAQRRAA